MHAPARNRALQALHVPRPSCPPRWWSSTARPVPTPVISSGARGGRAPRTPRRCQPAGPEPNEMMRRLCYVVDMYNRYRNACTADTRASLVAWVLGPIKSAPTPPRLSKDTFLAETTAHRPEEPVVFPPRCTAALCERCGHLRWRWCLPWCCWWRTGRYGNGADFQLVQAWRAHAASTTALDPSGAWLSRPAVLHLRPSRLPGAGGDRARHLEPVLQRPQSSSNPSRASTIVRRGRFRTAAGGQLCKALCDPATGRMRGFCRIPPAASSATPWGMAYSRAWISSAPPC